MSREVKRAMHKTEVNCSGKAMETSTGVCMPAPGAKSLLFDKDRQERPAGAIRFMEESFPGTLAELLEESRRSSFNILRGLDQ